MALTPRLEIRQSQNLTLTPQLMQSIKLLQLSYLEINSFVEEELLKNPLLEREENASDQSEAANLTQRDDVTEITALEGAAPADLVDTGEHLPSAAQVAGDMDTDVASLYPEQVGQDSVAASTNKYADISTSPAGAQSTDIDQYVAAKTTLASHLSEQVSLLVHNPRDRLIARNLIDNLDDKGYLASDCQTIAEQLGATPEQVEQVLLRIQGANPVGVFARDLKECLKLQLAENNRLDPMMAGLLDNLDLVAARDFTNLMTKIAASPEDLKDMLVEIRQLDPRPGRAFDGAPMQTVIPDVFVREGPGGDWVLELNSDVLPKVLVNRTYYATVAKRARNAEEKSFLVDCLQTANWLIKSLDQRAQTILKVATEIVRLQDGFLMHGVAHLKPMTLKNVADAIEMHESTVSRVTTHKYMATPRGVFEMKYFFTTALGSNEGNETHSAESVRYLIKQLIEKETLKSILSDDTIAQILSERHGIEVARRTVAKYREGMNIASSVIRRREKKNQKLAL